MKLLRSAYAALGRLLASAENPRPSTDGPIGQPELLQRLRAARAQVASARERLAAAAALAEARLPEFESEARDALAAGHEDLARLAVQRRYVLTEEACRLRRQEAQLVAEEERLRGAEQRLEARFDALKRRWEIASARYTAAEASLRIDDVLAGAGDDVDGGGLALARVEETVLGMQARASALDEVLRAENPHAPDPIADRIARLEEERVVEEQIEMLRRRLATDGI